MNAAAQTKYLNDALGIARRNHPMDYTDPKLPAPAAVRKARVDYVRASKVIDRWQAKVRQTRERRNVRIHEEYTKCREAILFGDAKAALAAIKKFEKMKF